MSRRRGVRIWQATWLVTKRVHTIPLAARSGQLSHLTVSSAVPLAQGDWYPAACASAAQGGGGSERRYYRTAVPNGLLKIALSPHSQPHFERSEKSAFSRISGLW